MLFSTSGEISISDGQNTYFSLVSISLLKAGTSLTWKDPLLPLSHDWRVMLHDPLPQLWLFNSEG